MDLFGNTDEHRTFDDILAILNRIADDFVNEFELPVRGVKVFENIGKGKDNYVNGHNVKGMPYVARYADAYGNYDWNINNYIITETIRVKEKVMPTYLIYDANELRTHQVIREVQASNAKQALIKFRNTLSSTGMYEIRKIKDGCWEMSSTYGAYFYCTKKEEK